MNRAYFKPDAFAHSSSLGITGVHLVACWDSWSTPAAAGGCEKDHFGNWTGCNGERRMYRRNML